MLKNNYHTHMKYCNHATGMVENYVKKAIELNMNELGMTDHGPVLKSFMTEEEYKHNWGQDNMDISLVEDYLNQIKECKEKYAGQIKIYAGFETEFLPEQIDYYKGLREKVDYLNLGLHFARYDGKVLNCYSDLNYQNVDGYLDNALKGMASGLYKTIVHPDLFMFGYKNINGERKMDDKAKEVARAILEAAIKNNMYVELNCGGLRSSRVYANSNEWLYPDDEFWTIASEYKNLKIIIGADAHDPSHLESEDIEEVKKFALKHNLKVCEKMEF